MNRQGIEPTIALLPWGDIWDDFLDSINISLETFCQEGPGGWMLGYIQGLKYMGVHTVLILISQQVDVPVYYEHDEIGLTITVLPAPAIYRWLRQQIINPNPYLASTSVNSYKSVNILRRLWSQVINPIVPYLATPTGLLKQEIQRLGCRAILCQEYESARFDVCVWLGKMLNLPVFASFQGGSYDPNLFGNLLFRRFTMQACQGLAIGPQTEITRVCQTYHLPSSKIAQIFNPIDISLWNNDQRESVREKLGLSPTTQVVVWHGRVEFYTKRLDILLDAWQQICTERPDQDLRLHLMGTGQDAEKLRCRIEALPIQNILWINKYVTERSEIKQFLLAGDIYAFPSMYEGFPVAPIEAMACSLPLVAAAASGVPDILKGGESSGGMLVPCGDVDAFTSALSRILDNSDLKRELSQKARKRVEEYFSLEVVGQQLRDFIIKLDD